MSDKYVVIGVDPGAMTGLFWWDNRGMYEPVAQQVSAEAFPVVFRNLLCNYVDWVGEPNVGVAVERYIITSRTAKLSQQSDALEVTGMAKAIVSLYGGPPVRQYLKANLKFASDDMLRTVGWHTPSMRHANDAARQAFALLKDVDYPAWAQLVKDGKLRAEDGRTHDDY